MVANRRVAYQKARMQLEGRYREEEEKEEKEREEEIRQRRFELLAQNLISANERISIGITQCRDAIIFIFLCAVTKKDTVFVHIFSSEISHFTDIKLSLI